MVDSQIRREIEFASIPENVNLVESLVEELKAEFGLSEEMEANMLVSLSEAVNNAIFHGNQKDPSKLVKIKLLKEDKILTFSVEDKGGGFNPAEVKDPTADENLLSPTGRGIFLMKTLADKVEFENGGRTAVLTFSVI
jgi:serine/threonine-protein kinase RsbW